MEEEEEEEEEEKEYDEWLESQLMLKRATVSESLSPQMDTIDNAISYAWDELTQTTNWMAHNASSIESQLCEATLEAEQHQSKYHTITSSPKKIELPITEVTGANSSRNKIGDAYLSLPVRDRNEIHSQESAEYAKPRGFHLGQRVSTNLGSLRYGGYRSF